MPFALPAAPDAGFSVIDEIVPPEILAPPMPHERRWLWRDECALVLDRYLRRLARQEALCRSVLGRIGAAFLRRRSHHRLGFARLGDYTRERLGISGRELQTLAYVVASMERLPKIRAAFDRGDVSWAQARILVDVATVGTEDQWLSRATGRTVRALAALCKNERRADAIGADLDENARDTEDMVDRELRTRFRVGCPRRVSSRWRRAVEVARRMSGEELSAWQAAEAIAAEGLSAREFDAERLDVSSLEQPPARDPRAGDDPDELRVSTPALDWEALSEAIPEPVEALAEKTEDADAFALDDRVRRVLRSLSRVDWQLGRLLRLFLDMRLHELAGFRSAGEYARDRLGMSARKARALVCLERKSMREPALADAYRAGEISWARALAIVPVLGERHAAEWVERATSTTFRRLVDEVEWAVETRDAVAPFRSIAPPPAGAALVMPERQTCARRDRDERPPVDSEVVFTGPSSVVSLLRVAVSAFAKPYEAPWRGLERLLDHVLAEWTSQPAHRDPVFARDGWRCAVPGCSSRRNLHDHHIVFRSHGGDNARDNRVAVCAWHHLHGLHAGTVRASGKAPDAIRWQLGWRPHAPALLESRLASEP